MKITEHRAATLLGHGIASAPAMEVDNFRGIIEVRLDRLTAQYEALLTSDNERTVLQAIAGLKSIEESRARLYGLNLSHTHHTKTRKR